MNHDSPSAIRALLEERGIALKKRWGQNFLINSRARERLVALLEAKAQDTAWEIGPGLGAMTGLLVTAVGRLFAFEVDRGICRYLAERYGALPGFRLVPGDFLDTWAGVRGQYGAPDRILGNLPYRSASLMIAQLVEGGVRPRSMVCTVQRELAERIMAAPGSKSYSSFSILCQSCFMVSDKGNLNPGSFYPAPDVVSTIVEMVPRAGAPDGRTLNALSALARGLFSSRRKTLRNNIASGRAIAGVEPTVVLSALEEAGVDPGMRAEELPPATFVRIARWLTGPEGL